MTCILYLLLAFCVCGKFVPCTNRLINIIIIINIIIVITSRSGVVHKSITMVVPWLEFHTDRHTTDMRGLPHI